MIGVYDYTVILTYVSLICGSIGILISLPGYGSPYIGVFFLLLCGLCDAFDGKIARTKKNRTDYEKNFGIQIDSLSDLVCFGVLPTCIGIATLRLSQYHGDTPLFKQIMIFKYYHVLLIGIAAFYVLAALIRLAHFNVTAAAVDDRNEEEAKSGKAHYTGLPVTSAALIFPFVLFLHFVTKFDFSILYFFVMLIVGILFLGKFKIKKIGGILLGLLIAIGVIEFILLVIVRV